MEKKVYVYKNEVNYEFIKNILPLLKKYKVKEKDIDAIFVKKYGQKWLDYRKQWADASKHILNDFQVLLQKVI